MLNVVAPFKCQSIQSDGAKGLNSWNLPSHLQNKSLSKSCLNSKKHLFKPSLARLDNKGLCYKNFLQQ